MGPKRKLAVRVWLGGSIQTIVYTGLLKELPLCYHWYKTKTSVILITMREVKSSRSTFGNVT
jgi:hypothetical protein